MAKINLIELLQENNAHRQAHWLLENALQASMSHGMVVRVESIHDGANFSFSLSSPFEPLKITSGFIEVSTLNIFISSDKYLGEERTQEMKTALLNYLQSNI